MCSRRPRRSRYLCLRHSSLHNTLPSILVSSPHRCAAAGSLADVQLQSSPLPPYSHPQQQSCTTRTSTDWLTTPVSAALLLLFLSSMQHAQSVYVSPQCSSCPPPIDSSHLPTRLPPPSSRPAHRSCSLAPFLYCSSSSAPSFAAILPVRSSSPPLSSSPRSVAAAARPTTPHSAALLLLFLSSMQHAQACMRHPNAAPAPLLSIAVICPPASLPLLPVLPIAAAA